MGGTFAHLSEVVRGSHQTFSEMMLPDSIHHHPGHQHPGAVHMREAVESGVRAREAQDWIAVGTANMKFHKSIVELADSPRLVVFYGQISAELRLAFGLLNDPKFLHLPYLDMNASILQCLEEGKAGEATAMLESYLVQSERTVLAAYERSLKR